MTDPAADGHAVAATAHGAPAAEEATEVADVAPPTWFTPVGAVPALLPIAARSRLDAIAADANHRRHAQAQQWLGRCFEPADALLGGAEPFEVVASHLAFTGPDAEQLIDRLLVVEDNRPPRLGFGLLGARATDDQIDFRATYDILRPDVATVEAKLAAGATLMLAGVEGHHRALQDLAIEIDELMGPGGSIDLLVLGPEARLEVRPRDDVDWVVLPLDEPITFELGDREVEVSPGSGAVIRYGGEALAIARAHARATVARLSLPHATVGAFTALADERARHHPLLRADLPTRLGRPVASYGGSLYDDAGGYATGAAQLIDEQLVAEARARSRQATSAPRRTALDDALAWLDGSSRAIRFVPPGGLLVVDAPDGPRLALAGHQLVAHSAIQEGLAALADGRWCALDRELGVLGLSPDQAGTLVRELLSSGVLEVAPAAAAEAIA
ncbi:MAG TPA: hypothetical protein VGM93_14515 [Acidimicrobiales bacterium]